MKKKLIRYIAIAIIVYLLILLVNGMSKSPVELGINNGLFAASPASPNCVNSQADKDDAQHYIDPLQYSIKETVLLEHIDAVLAETARTQILLAKDDYFHVEFTTLLLRFKDDFEIYIDSDKKLMHFRSASRIGHSDFGANRKRVEKFKKDLLAKI